MPSEAEAREDVIACCSFCLKPNTEVRALVAGPAMFVCDDCVDPCGQIIADVPDRSPRLLPWELTDSLDAALSNIPNVARAQAQVGDALGITRQSAWERFAAEE